MQNIFVKGLVGVLLFLLILVIITSILELIGMWKVFKKAGKKGWEAIIPYYNLWTLVSISEVKWWFFLLAIASSLISFGVNYNIYDTNIIINSFDCLGSLLNLFVMYAVNFNISKKFNKDYIYAIGLTLLPFVFYPMLGFSSLKYDKNIKVSPFGVIKEGDR